MKKTGLYLIILAVLAGLTYWFVFKEEAPAFALSEANFTVKDTNDIETIFLSSLKNENIKISRKNNTWVLNDSLSIRLDAVSGLLGVLQKQYAEKPVAPGYHDAAIKELSATGTKVEIYTKRGKTHCFYVGQIPTPDNATYMLTEGAKRPYVVKLPLDNNFVGVRYFTSLTDWRNKKIMFANSPIEKVAVNYKDSMQHSFSMTIGSDTLVNTEMNTATTPNAFNRKRVISYLGFYDKLFCTGYETNYIYKDSILDHGKQMATITVQRKGTQQQTLVLYFKPASHDTKLSLQVDGEEYDGNYFFGWLNNHDFIIVNRTSAMALLRKGNEFFEQD
jgi:hypothetical protein